MSEVSTTHDRVSSDRVGADHPGIRQLFGVLLAGELAAFYRLTDEAQLAPDLQGRLAMARMAASEMRHFEVLAGRLSSEVAVEDAIVRFAPVLERYHSSTPPNTWLEALVKSYIGDGLAADFYLEVASVLPTEAEQVVRTVMAETASSHFACAEVRRAVTENPDLIAPLTLWGRRLLGEAITQAQHVLAAEDTITDLLFAGSDLNRMAEFFESIQDRHVTRMSDLGLG
nr:ferritin-like fold-containing protein [Williamsia sterculiae]